MLKVKNLIKNTPSKSHHPDILRENQFDSNEEYVSYNADLLFTIILLGKTIYFILDEI